MTAVPTILMMFAAVASALPAAANGRELGLNFDAPLDWSPAKPYADVIRQSRNVVDFSGNPTIPRDTNGWPMASVFRIGLWSGIARMDGTYTVYFDGTLTEPPRVNGADDVGPVQVYGGSTRTFTFHVSNASAENLCQIDFRGAMRPDGAHGLTNIKVMRPLQPGSRRSYPPSALFNDALKAILQKVQVVRFMDFLATNANQQVEWRDRPKPSWMSFARHVAGGDEPDVEGRCPHGYSWEGIGGPLEHVVLLANAIDRDAWINIPARASDDYVTKVAQLFAFGSDGDLPFTGPFGSVPDPTTNPRPASHDPAERRDGTVEWYPPLAHNLNLYIEYGNEIWNFAAPFDDAFKFNRQQAMAEIGSGKTSLSYDGDRDKGGARRLARRALEISRIFRTVFGDAQMPATGNARVRPVLASFQYDPNAWLGEMLKYLQGYWNNGEGHFVADPHPPAYDFFGAGGSAYYAPSRDGIWEKPPTIENVWTLWDMDAEHWRTFALENEAYRCAAFGLRRIAYEGGPDFGRWQRQGDILKRAVSDARMRRSILDHDRAWTEMGGGLAVFFTAVGDYSFGWTSDVSDPSSSQKMQALDELRTVPEAPLTIGVKVPGAAAGAAHAGSTNGWEAPTPRAGGARTFAGPAGWAGYVFRASDSSSRRAILSLSGARGTVSVYSQGVLVGTRTARNGSVAFDLGRIGPGLVGIIVRAASGSFTLERIAIE